MHETTIYLPQDLKHAIARLAQARGVSEAALMREATILGRGATASS
jgi:predicted transcriptional regulator